MWLHPAWWPCPGLSRKPWERVLVSHLKEAGVSQSRSGSANYSLCVSPCAFTNEVLSAHSHAQSWTYLPWLLPAAAATEPSGLCAWPCPEKAGCPAWMEHFTWIRWGGERCPLCPALGSLVSTVTGRREVSTDPRLGYLPGLPVVSTDPGNSESCFSLSPCHASQAGGPLAAAGEPGDKEQEGPVCDDAEAAVPPVQLLGEGASGAGTVLGSLDPPAPGLPARLGGVCLQTVMGARLCHRCPCCRACWGTWPWIASGARSSYR